jgi:hypothetical protein
MLNLGIRSNQTEIAVEEETIRKTSGEEGAVKK